MSLTCSKLGWVSALVSLGQISIIAPSTLKSIQFRWYIMITLVSGSWLSCQRPHGTSLSPTRVPKCPGANDHSSLSSPFFQPQGTLSVHRLHCYQMLPSSLHALQTLCWLWRIYSDTISNWPNVQEFTPFHFSLLSGFPEFILVTLLLILTGILPGNTS